ARLADRHDARPGAHPPRHEQPDESDRRDEEKDEPQEVAPVRLGVTPIGNLLGVELSDELWVFDANRDEPAAFSVVRDHPILANLDLADLARHDAPLELAVIDRRRGALRSTKQPEQEKGEPDAPKDP